MATRQATVRKGPPLVGGFLERISVRAFERYYQDIAGLVQEHHGVYALYKDDRLYYVGLAVKLRRRIKQHVRDKHANRWNRFSLYLVRKVDHIKEIEALLLRISSPIGNHQGGRLRRAINLDRALRRSMIRRQKEEMDEIFSPQRRRRVGQTRRSKAQRGTYRQMVDRPLKGMGGKRLYATYKGKEFKAIVFRNGRIKLDGQIYDSPSAAGKAVRNRPTNGWLFWHVRDNGRLVKLKEKQRDRRE